MLSIRYNIDHLKEITTMSKTDGTTKTKPDTSTPGTNWNGRESTGGIVNSAPSGLNAFQDKKRKDGNK